MHRSCLIPGMYASVAARALLGNMFPHPRVNKEATDETQFRQSRTRRRAVERRAVRMDRGARAGLLRRCFRDRGGSTPAAVRGSGCRAGPRMDLGRLPLVMARRVVLL